MPKHEKFELPDEGVPEGPWDYLGQEYGIFYRAWQIHPPGSVWAFKVRVFTWNAETGELYDHARGLSSRLVTQRIPYAFLKRPSGILQLCRSMYWNRVRAEPAEVPVIERHCPDVANLLTEARKKAAQEATRRRAANILGKSPEQVSAADFSTLHRDSYL